MNFTRVMSKLFVIKKYKFNTKKSFVIAFLVITFNGFSQTPRFTKDINTAYQSSSPTSFFEHNGFLYFTATGNASQGAELWRTDGSDTLTKLVKDINVGVSSSNPSNYVTVGNTLFFKANDGVNGIELWKTDGTELGTQMVKDIYSGSASSSATPLHYLSNKGVLLFGANESIYGTELWVTDGTENGTRLLKDINPGLPGSNVSGLKAMGNLYFFIANNGLTGNELWVTDGTDTGTFLLNDIRAGSITSNVSQATVLDSILFFTANDNINGTELWRTNGTVAGTYMIKDIRPGSNAGSVGNLIVFDGKLFFTANDGVLGNELWTSDGTTAGTNMYMDYIKGAGAPALSNPTIYNNTLYFSGTGIGVGNELFRLDPIDTLSYIDIDKNGSSSPTNLTVVGNKLFFLASVDNGIELYVTDGTEAGTKLTRDLYPIQTDAQISLMTVVGNTLYFVSHESPNYQNFELYAATSTNTTPYRVKDIIPGAVASNPTNLLSFNGKLIFTVDDQINGLELWHSTSTSNATLLKDIYAGTKDAGITSMAAYNGGVMFNAITDVGNELWKSNGLAANTLLVKDIIFGSGSSTPRDFFTDQGRVYFTAMQTSNLRLNYSDGTETGTNYIGFGSGNFAYEEKLRIGNNLYFVFSSSISTKNLYRYISGSSGNKVVTINPNGLGDYVRNLTSFKGKLYFTADDGNTSGNELRKSDGTSGGTQLVKDIRSGSADSDPSNLLALDTLLLFTANNGTTGSELWVSGGETSNTNLLKDIKIGAASSNISQMTQFKNKAFFIADDGINGVELWSSDGTESNTQLFKDIIVGASGSYPSQLIANTQYLYFVVNDSVHGNELWVSDGTLAGTQLLKDINVGIGSANIGNLTFVRDMLYFTANDGINGNELWKTDGTLAGTTMIDEVYVGANGSNPTNLTLANDTLYYVANHPTYGNELWYVFTNCMVKGMNVTSGCVNDSLQFTDLTNPLGNTITKYRWDFGNGDTSNIQNPKYAFNQPGEFAIKLNVESLEGCKTETTQTITIDSFPIAVFTINNDTQCLKNNSFVFTNQSTVGSTYKWEYGNSQSATTTNLTYAFTQAGSFTVKLTASSSFGCSTIASQNVLVNPTPAKPVIIGKQLTQAINIDTFTVTNNSGSTYNWLATNASIVLGQGTNQISVDWDNSKTSSVISVIETNIHGCASDQTTKTVALSTVGISNQTLLDNVVIYPNPAEETLTIKTQTKGFISLIDVNGKRLIKEFFDANIDIDISLLPSGLYFVLIESNEGTFGQKIIKR